jgi:hypothetical protein
MNTVLYFLAALLEGFEVSMSYPNRTMSLECSIVVALGLVLVGIHIALSSYK